MITRVELKYFKRFKDETFDLRDVIVLAGANNSGKSTLLQALAVWNLGIQRWVSEKGRGPEEPSAPAKGGSVGDENPALLATGASEEPRLSREPERTEPNKHRRAKRSKSRPGVRISRKDFSAIPLRNLDLLWYERHKAYRKGEGSPERAAGAPKLIRIHVEGRTDGDDWELTLDLRCENSEILYVIPVADDPFRTVPYVADKVQVVHVPPFSGIGAEETRFDRPYQDHLIGQGKPGDILRNLLLEVHAPERADDWKQLVTDIRDLFGCELLDPVYDGPFILCEYRPDSADARGGRSAPKLDIASAGSGFHQVLMVLGFFYSRPGSVLLLDEPDAHQHIILQKRVYERLRHVAQKRKRQLIIATHSEVILQTTSVDRIMSFYDRPHVLQADVERDEVREALKHVTAMDLLLAERNHSFLYTEGRTDLDILREWARVLDHELLGFLENPAWHNNVGRNPRDARTHLFALRAIEKRIKGALLLDGDNRSLPDHELAADNFLVLRWPRYEIENYLIVPSAMERFLGRIVAGELFLQDAVRRGREFLEDELPRGVLNDPLGQHDYLNSTKGSRTLLPGFFKAAGVPMPSTEYYQIAAVMEKDEINPEVRDKLDDLAKFFGPDAK